MELEKLKIKLDILKKAFLTLESVFDWRELTDLECDWVIQRFEYNVELSWKLMKSFLIYEKVDFLPTPREILKKSFEVWIISNLELWLDFLDIRNKMSHTYDEYSSEQSFDKIEMYYFEIWNLIKQIERLIK